MKKDEKVRNNGKTRFSRAEEGNCNEAIKADHPLTAKATPEYILKCRGKQKRGLNEVRNNVSYMEQYILHKVSNRQLHKGVGCMETTKSRLRDVHGRKETHKPERLHHGTKRS